MSKRINKILRRIEKDYERLGNSYMADDVITPEELKALYDYIKAQNKKPATRKEKDVCVVLVVIALAVGVVIGFWLRG